MELLAGVIRTHKLTDMKHQRSDNKANSNFRSLSSTG